MTERGLVARNADQPQPRASRGGARHLVDGGRSAAARATAGQADLDAHVDGPRLAPLSVDAICSTPRTESTQHISLNSGSAVALGGDPAQAAAVDQLVGEL